MLGQGEAHRVRLNSSGTAHKLREWAEVVHTVGAETLANFETDCTAGFRAITRNTFGAVRADCLAGDFPRETVSLVLEEALGGGFAPPASLNSRTSPSPISARPRCSTCFEHGGEWGAACGRAPLTAPHSPPCAFRSPGSVKKKSAR
ncbi:beta-galactosidase trimerization domain-containing protein [Deinococcus hopiensis]|uniref:beta-galactosidase trimerization domain-containing protein n=1 Tax=Deinococcus hopiensis TaxID=309885 RepID=UPI00148392DC|nr:beta-galactosidase trimerization domain-containing protein [Deinococcus hopiensis]